MSMRWEELHRIDCSHTLAPQPRTDPATWNVALSLLFSIHPVKSVTNWKGFLILETTCLNVWGVFNMKNVVYNRHHKYCVFIRVSTILCWPPARPPAWCRSPPRDSRGWCWRSPEGRAGRLVSAAVWVSCVLWTCCTAADMWDVCDLKR